MQVIQPITSSEDQDDTDAMGDPNDQDDEHFQIYLQQQWSNQNEKTMIDVTQIPQNARALGAGNLQENNCNQNSEMDKKNHSGLYDGYFESGVKIEITAPGLAPHVEVPKSNASFFHTREEEHPTELLSQTQDPMTSVAESKGKLNIKVDSLHTSDNPQSTNQNSRVLVIEPKQCMCQICHATDSGTDSNVKFKIKSSTVLECEECGQQFRLSSSVAKHSWYQCIECQRGIKLSFREFQFESSTRNAGRTSSRKPEELVSKLFDFEKLYGCLQMIEIPVLKPVSNDCNVHALHDAQAKLESSDILSQRNKESPRRIVKNFPLTKNKGECSSVTKMVKQEPGNSFKKIVIPLVDICKKDKVQYVSVGDDSCLDIKEERSIIDVQKCNMCETWIVGQEQIKKHTTSCTSRHNGHWGCMQRTCRRCGKIFKTKAGLMRHRTRSNCIQTTGMKCSICSEILEHPTPSNVW